MDGIVIDSSIAIAWFFPTSDKEKLYAASVLRHIVENGINVYIPQHFHIEVAEFLMKRRRNKAEKFTQTKLDQTLDILNKINPRTMVTQDSYNEIVKLSVKYHIQAKDVPFIHLAHQFKMPIATLDGGQRQAAATFGIKLIQFN